MISSVLKACARLFGAVRDVGWWALLGALVSFFFALDFFDYASDPAHATWVRVFCVLGLLVASAASLALVLSGLGGRSDRRDVRRSSGREGSRGVWPLLGAAVAFFIALTLGVNSLFDEPHPVWVRVLGVLASLVALAIALLLVRVWLRAGRETTLTQPRSGP